MQLMLDDAVSRSVARIRSWARQRRGAIMAVAACGFLVGMALSVGNLGLELDRIALWPIVLVCAVGTPLSILANAFELQVCAVAVDRRIPLHEAIGVTATAAVANLLPVPASLAIRGAALVSSGATLRDTGAVLLAAGVMWLGIAIVLTGLAAGTPVGFVLGLAGALTTAACFDWTRRKSGMALAAALFAVRFALLAILIVRLWLVFAAIGSSMSLVDTGYYAAAGVAGAVAVIVPAGLGVTETLAALLADLAGASPAAAILAMGLNRILGLIACGLVAGGYWLRPRLA